MFGDKGKSARKGVNTVETLIGPQVVIRGDVSFSGGLYVEGRIIGKVVADEGATAVLTVAAQGVIEGEVRVPVIVIAGQMQGEVFASERIELASNARVTGNVHYKVVEMTAGAMITGRLIHVDDTKPEAAVAQIAGSGEAA
jgi:cytoskeletal protein CcmA (bactofilin family)